MDPNATLRAIFAATDKAEAIELCEALAGWLRGGGFAPTVTPDAKYWPGTGTSYAVLSPGYDTGGVWMFVRYNQKWDRIEGWILPVEAAQ